MKLFEWLQIMPESEPWTKWQQKTGEMPPDFDSMPSRHRLPDIMARPDGTRVSAPEQWPEQREMFMALLKRFAIGTYPDPPKNLEARVISETKESSAVRREIELSFGPEKSDRRAVLWLEVVVPDGLGPMPVFITQHNHAGWARIAASRGYIAARFAGSDSRDDTAAFADLWPGYDWTKLTRRAWAASRCLDYILSLPEADAAKVAMAGHSRNGKQTLIASAMDARISAAISSSSGVGGACPYRLFSEAQMGEGIELITRVFPDWLHPRLRYFAGFEHKLPIDANILVAMTAPRACLIATALNDNVESTYAIEECARAAMPAYELLGVPDKLRILYRYGDHPTQADDIERYMDWCDEVFGRSDRRSPPPGLSGPFHPYTLRRWKRGSNKVPPPPSPKALLPDRIAWLMGDPPPSASREIAPDTGEPYHQAVMLRRGGAPEGLERHMVSFGQYLYATVFAPKGSAASEGKIAGVLWLHPHSVPTGAMAAYLRGEQAPHVFAKAGLAVFCYDHIGFGSRIMEGAQFYDRYPNWSLFGKMMHDAFSAFDAFRELPFVDPDKIFLVGHGLGGMLAIHMAAQDKRPAGVASCCGFEPFSTPPSHSGGIARLCEWDGIGLLPRLARFVGRESKVPYDFDELLKAIAPRPVLIISPKYDRENYFAAVAGCLDKVRDAFEPWALKHLVPEDYNRLSPRRKEEIASWLRDMAGIGRSGGAK